MTCVSRAGSVNVSAVLSTMKAVGLLLLGSCCVPMVAGAAEDGYVFGRTYEREMKPEDSRYLDLDTAELVDGLPRGDLFWAFDENDPKTRLGKDMVALAVEAERWNASAAEVLGAVSNTTAQAEVRFNTDLTGVWFFKTREGATGVLRMLPHEKKPGAVIVRFKRIRPRRKFEPAATVVLSPAGQPVLALTE